MNIQVGQVVRHIPTGDLLVVRERYEANKYHRSGYRCAPIDNRWSTGGYADDVLEPAPPHKPGGFDYKTEIVPRAQGAIPWEHIEPANLAQTLSNIAACAGWSAYPAIAWVQKPGNASQDWARIFLHTTATIRQKSSQVHTRARSMRSSTTGSCGAWNDAPLESRARLPSRHRQARWTERR